MLQAFRSLLSSWYGSIISLCTLAFVSIFLSGAAQAQTFLPVQGGPGGSDFTRECSGDFVNGIYVRCRRLGRRDRSEMRDLQSDFDAVQSAAVEHAVFWWRRRGWFPRASLRQGSICQRHQVYPYGGGKSPICRFHRTDVHPSSAEALQTRCALKRDREQYAHPGNSFRPARLATRRQPVFEVVAASTSTRLD